MGDRLQGRVVVVVGGGQTPGETIGNGRAAAILYAREGARVLVVDRVLLSAEHTVAMIRDEGGEAVAHAADITDAGLVRDHPGGSRSRRSARSTCSTTTSGSAAAISRRRGSRRTRGSGSSTSTCRRCGGRARR